MANRVRMAGEDDIPAILELLKQVNKVHHDGRPDLFRLATKYTPEELEGILKDPETPVGTAVVYGDDFHLAAGLCEETVQALPQIFLRIIDRDDNGYDTIVHGRFLSVLSVVFFMIAYYDNTSSFGETNTDDL